MTNLVDNSTTTNSNSMINLPDNISWDKAKAGVNGELGEP